MIQMIVRVVAKRARTVRGRYRGDDKSTPDVNEAYVTVPKKRSKKKKKRSVAKK